MFIRILLLFVLVTLIAPSLLAQRGRGGFDPSEFLGRLDANGNGVIDVDEQQGPAKFMISRLQRYDPEIKEGEPIPLSRIVETFEKARAEREGGGDQRSDGGRRSDRDRERDERAIADEAVTVELLVPGFGNPAWTPPPLLGFGPAAELLTVSVTAEDQQEAAKRMQYFDKNKDGVLTADELTSQFAGNPMDFDRNRDGRLTERELAVRYAVRREGNEAAEQATEDDKAKPVDRSQRTTESDLYNGRKSYRIDGPRRAPEGLPGYFTDRDTNGDGQIAMAEFASEWSEAVVEEFFAADSNRDGLITAEEALRAVEAGQSPSPGKPTLTASPAVMSAPTEKSTPKAKREAGTAGSKNQRYAERIVKRSDTNGDGVLTPTEWKEMLMSPAKADFDRDGKVTVAEYTRWLDEGKR
jgi:Ca2+-binding EF-hand superfamily protein